MGKMVYVASKFQNRDAVRAAQKRLLEQGCFITHDWTNEDFALADQRGMTRDQYANMCAEGDFFGASTADVVLLLADYDPALGSMKGGFVEAGIGMGYGALVFCVAPAELTVFDHLPCWQRFDTLDAALAAIEELG